MNSTDTRPDGPVTEQVVGIEQFDERDGSMDMLGSPRRVVAPGDAVTLAEEGHVQYDGRPRWVELAKDALDRFGIPHDERTIALLVDAMEQAWWEDHNAPGHALHDLVRERDGWRKAMVPVERWVKPERSDD